jgi:hypothetical protein
MMETLSSWLPSEIMDLCYGPLYRMDRSGLLIVSTHVILTLQLTYSSSLLSYPNVCQYGTLRI